MGASSTPVGIYMRRVATILRLGSRPQTMWGLRKATARLANFLLAAPATTCTYQPQARIAKELQRQGITNVSFILQSPAFLPMTVDKVPFPENERIRVSVEQMIATSLRYLALNGAKTTSLNFSEAASTAEADYLFARVDLRPSAQDPARAEVSLRLEDASLVEKRGWAAREKIVKNILDKLPKQTTLSLARFREYIANIVLADETLFPAFSRLTHTLSEAEITKGKLSAKAQALKETADQEFPFLQRRKLHWLLQFGFWIMRQSPILFYLGFKIAVYQASRLIIAGDTTEKAIKKIKAHAQSQVGYYIEFVARGAESAAQADKILAKYLAAIDKLPGGTAAPEKVASITLSCLVPNFSSGSIEEAVSVLRQLALRASEKRVLLVINMEQHVKKEIIFQVFKRFHREAGFRYLANLGLVLQTYLTSSLDDTKDLIALTQEARSVTESPAKLFIRFVKGAYHRFDTKHILPSFEAVNARFKDCVELALEQSDRLRIAIASYNLATLSAAIEMEEIKKLPPDTLEFDMLPGLPASPILLALANQGRKTRFCLVIGPFAELIGYFLRRMTENVFSGSCLNLLARFRRGELGVVEYLKLVSGQDSIK